MQRRHFTATHLVQNLSRFCIGLRIGRFRLISSEALQHAFGDVRAPPQHLHGGDQAVAPECRRKPRDAGIRIASLRRIGHQHFKIGCRTAQDLVEQVVRRFGAGAAVCRIAKFAS